MYFESWALYAALAIADLSMQHYTPACRPRNLEYSTTAYSKALRSLNERVTAAMDAAEVAVLGSIVFFLIEHLLAEGHHSSHDRAWVSSSTAARMALHVNSAFAILSSTQSKTGPSYLMGKEQVERALHRMNYELTIWK